MKTKHLTCCTILFLLATNTVAWSAGLRDEMEAANSEWLAAYNASNTAELARLYTQNAMLLAPGGQPVVGSEAIEHFWADAVKDGKEKNHTFKIVSVFGDGKYAYMVARWTLDILNDKGGIEKAAGNTVRVLEKQPNGKWLTKIHIFNAD